MRKCYGKPAVVFTKAELEAGIGFVLEVIEEDSEEPDIIDYSPAQTEYRRRAEEHDAGVQCRREIAKEEAASQRMLNRFKGTSEDDLIF